MIKQIRFLPSLFIRGSIFIPFNFLSFLYGNHTFILPLLLLLFVNVSSSKAQGVNFWSEPVQLFEVKGEGEIHTPFVISDPYGNVHVFWSVISESDYKYDLIYYTRLDEMGWTTPVDIVATTSVRAPRAAIGHDNYIYLIWNGPGGISYSRAPIQGAEFVQNWSQPVLITDASPHADLGVSPIGNIYLAYPGTDNSGVFLRVLDTNNLDWSSPKTVSPSSLTNTGAEDVKMAVSSNGTLHVVWTEYYLPDGWPPRGVFYSRLAGGDNNWSVPVMLAGDGYDEINIAVLDDNTVHVAWNGSAGFGGRYHRWSFDEGQDWSETVEVIPAGLGGTEGPPQLIGDSSGTLHMLTTYDACAWYTNFMNQRWAKPVCVSGEKARASNYIEEPTMALSEGNKLHAVFWDDRKRLWYATRLLEASWIPPRIIENELIRPTSNQTPADSPLVTPTTNSTNLLTDQQLNAPPRFVFNPGQILIFSLLPVTFLIILIVVLIYSKRMR